MTSNHFHILLPSNVSTKTFAKNNPSRYSTILADDITLPGDGWEVAVKNIMYPSRIATMSDEDTIKIFKYKDNYRKLLPAPTRGEHENKQNHVPLKLDLSKASMTAEKGGKVPMAEAIANYINSIAVKMKVNKVFKIRAKETNGVYKFIVDMPYEDVVCMMHADLRKYLGFEKDIPITKGTLWSWSAFNPAAEKPSREKQIMFVGDLRNQISQKYIFTTSYETGADGVIVPGGDVFYTAEVPLRFKDNKDDDLLWEPKITFIIKPLSGVITLLQPKRIPADIARYERKINFFRFPVNIQKAFKLDSLYFHHRWTKSSYTIQIPKSMNADISTNVDIPFFYGEVFFEGVRELDSVVDETPIETIKINESMELEKPSDFLAPLNKSAALRDYKFHYDEEHKRFTIWTGKETFLQFSDTLASILGFTTLSPDRFIAASSTVTAAECPVLDRAITTLYVYSNIVNSMYVGDVKAPLLLACPFRKDPNSNMNQLEF